MRKQSLAIAMFVAALVVSASCLHAAEKSGYFFGTVDYFLAGDVADEIETDASEGAAASTALGDPATANTDVANGVGGRIGYLRNLNPHFSLGGSVGYIVGPKSDTKINFLPGGVSGFEGYVNSTIESTYLRLLAEGVGKYPLNEKVSLNLGLGLGVAKAETTQETTGILTDGIIVASVDNEFDESEVGFTWEVSPSIEFNFEKIALLLGLRYAQFPKIDGTQELYEIDWKGLGFFAGFKF